MGFDETPSIGRIQASEPIRIKRFGRTPPYLESNPRFTVHAQTSNSGRNQMSEQRSYDIAMTAKKKLLAIPGAVSSIKAGMPSVSDLNLCMKRWSEEWASQIGYPNVFNSLWDTVNAYYQSGNAHNGPTANFEKVLGELIALAH